MLLLLLACTDVEPLDRAAMLDPDSCAECHPSQHDQWQGSMHAYAGIDPLFLAMNARGQRETDGALGDFCVKCHAPMAVVEGVTTDGLNLDEIDQKLVGIGCFACHAVDGVEALHNNGLTYSDDLVMRGGIADPLETPAHASAHSDLHDRSEIDSASMCGACHDIVTPAGVALERSYQEWLGTKYAQPLDGVQQTCGNCHMDGQDGPAAEVDGAPIRRIHSHEFPGVDVAMTDFPNRDEQEAAVQAALDTVVLPTLGVCVDGEGVKINLTLDNVSAGHSFPSGAAQDRRAWVELTAWQGETVLLKTGDIGPDEAVMDVEDENLWRLGDQMIGADGQPVHMFWEATDVVSELLPGLPPDVISHPSRTWNLGESYPDKVEVRMHLRALDVDVIQSLIDSGDLDPSYADAIPQRELKSSVLTWQSLVEPCAG